MRKCLICGKELQKKFPQHLQMCHNLTPQEYYDQYIKQDGEGVCVVCGKPVKFNVKGMCYAKTCSHSCTFKHTHNEIQSDPERREKWAEHSRKALQSLWEKPEQREKWIAELSEMGKRRTTEGFNPNPLAGKPKIKEVDPNARDFPCPLCDYTYKGVSSRFLKEHVISEHGIEPNHWIDFLRDVYWPKFYPNKATHCLVCGKPTRFADFGVGFASVCSVTCQQHLLNHCDRDSAFQRHQEIEHERKMLSGVRYLFELGQIEVSSSKGFDYVHSFDKSSVKYLIEYSQDTYKRDKLVQHYMEKYGVDHHSKAQEVKDKKRQICQERFGYDTNLQSPEQIEKIRQTCRDKYGYDIFLSKMERKRLAYLSDKDDFVEGKTLSAKCELCDKEFEFTYDSKSFNTLHCPFCYEERHSSSYENWICRFLDEQGITYTRHERKLFLSERTPSEVDIYLPEHNIGIEVDGLYWHSTGDPDRHTRKTEEFKRVYDSKLLLHVTDSEIDYKPDIVKSIILAKCGIFRQRVPARKCEIRQISNQQCKDFTNATHIQGHSHASTLLGAFYQGKLVSVCTFGSGRTPKDERREVELIRFCCSPYTQVIGGLSKFVKFYLRHFPSEYPLISFCDLRYASTSGYLASGFEALYTTKPRYWYWSDSEPWLHNRRSFQRASLERRFADFDPNLSEYDNCLKHGWYRYYDCGSVKMVYTGTI